MIHLFANGDLLPEDRTLWGSSIVVPVPCPTPEDPHKLRPITLCEALMKLAEQHVIETHMDQIRQYLEPVRVLPSVLAALPGRARSKRRKRFSLHCLRPGEASSEPS